MIDRPIAFAAPGLVIAGQRRNPLEQGGFAGTVLADDDTDRPRDRKQSQDRTKVASDRAQADWCRVSSSNS
jgi:hypothetical protein